MSQKNHYPKIKVFVTKSKQFRASIQDEKDSHPYEVTVGGESWKAGKCREHETKIQNKCRSLMIRLQMNLSSFEEPRNLTDDNFLMMIHGVANNHPFDEFKEYYLAESKNYYHIQFQLYNHILKQ